MTITITRVHGVLFVVLGIVQVAGIWIEFTRTPLLAALPKGVLINQLFMVPGSAFPTTVIIMELLRGLRRKQP